MYQINSKVKVDNRVQQSQSFVQKQNKPHSWLMSIDLDITSNFADDNPTYF